jgi:hypothetical protein
MSKQSFPAALRIVQSVADLATTEGDSLIGINTSELSPDAIVAVEASNALYILHKGDSTTPPSSPDIILPNAGPGRWFRYGPGPGNFQDVLVSHALIPNQSSVDSAFTIAGAGTGDIVEYNITDSGLPTGVTTGPVRITGANAATMRFSNVTSTTVAAATVSFRMAVLQG